MRQIGMAHARTIALCGFALAGDVLAQGWVDRTAVGGPPAMFGHSLCWDPVRQYVLLVKATFDVATASTTLATWSWDGSAWTDRGTNTMPFPTSWTSLNSLPSGYQGTLLVMPSTGSPWFITGSATTTTTTGNYVLNCQCLAWDGATWNATAEAALPWTGSSAPCFAGAHHASSNEIILAQTGNPSRVVGFDGATFSTRNALTPLGLSTISITNHAAGQNNFAALDPSTGRIVATQFVTTSATARFFEWTGLGWNQRLPNSTPTRAGAVTAHASQQCLVMFDSDTTNLQSGHTWTYANGVMQRLVLPLEPTLRSASAMAYDPIRDVCVLFGGREGLTSQPLGDTWELRLPAAASFTPFGAGCAGSRGVPGLAAQTGSLPRAGTVFAASVTNLPWTGPAVLALGVSDQAYGGTPLPLDLGFLGAPGCSLRASIEDLFVLTNVLGAATWSFAIPPVPGAVFYAQALPFDAAANPLGLTVSNAARGVVGF